MCYRKCTVERNVINLWITNPGVSFMWVEKSTECNFVWISSNPNNMNYDENILCSQ